MYIIIAVERIVTISKSLNGVLEMVQEAPM